MLESRSLLIIPWEGRRRRIVAADDRTPLGFVALATSERHFFGALFGRGRTMEIHEAEDESLLATIRRVGILKKSWNVLDADNRLVGRLQPSRGSGVLVSNVPVAPARNHEPTIGMEIDDLLHRSGRFANMDREGRLFPQDLGTLEGCGSDQVLHFSEKLDAKPLLKLLLLAAVLIP
jgi:hypothetical protein